MTSLTGDSLDDQPPRAPPANLTIDLKAMSTPPLVSTPDGRSVFKVSWIFLIEKPQKMCDADGASLTLEYSVVVDPAPIGTLSTPRNACARYASLKIVHICLTIY